MNDFDIARRMREVMEDRGLKPKDFYNDENYCLEENFELLTKTRFHQVLSGKTKHPGDDFVPTFCSIAKIDVGEFYRYVVEPDEFTCSLDDKEKQFIIKIRKLRNKPGKEHLYSYIDAFLNGIENGE